MQVMLNSVRLSLQNKKVATKKQQTNLSNQKQNNMELSNFNSIGRSLVSFRGLADKELDLSKKSISELMELRELRTAKRETIEAKKRDAQNKLDAIAQWNYSSEYLKQQNEAEAEINSRGLSRFWNPFQCNDIRQKHFNEFKRHNSEIEGYKARMAQYKDLIDMAPLSDDEAREYIASIDAMIEQKMQIEEQEKRLKGIEGIKNAIESMSNAHGGLDDRIAGYDYEKDEIRRAFISPLAESHVNPEVKVPSSVMLYGASGTGKTTFLYGIKDEAKQNGYARVIEMSEIEDPKDFETALKREFGKARVLYNEKDDDGNPKRVRTILLMNDAEKYFGMSLEEAKFIYGDLINPTDVKRLKEIQHNGALIDIFKPLLDNCSGVPDENSNDALANSAVTIFITTNYPHLIDRDLIRKFDVILPVNPAKNVNLEEVMKHYFKKCSDVLDEVKKAASNPNFRARDLKFLSCYLNKKSIDTLVKMVEEGTLDRLSIDWENIPYDKIAKDFNPSKSKGAFDNKQLCDLAIASLNDYIEDPNRKYSGHYYARLYSEPRKLDPVRYKHFVDIFNTLAPLNKQEDVDPLIMQRRQKEILLGLEKIGELTEKDQKQLEYIRAQEQQELNYLEYKEKEETLSEQERTRLNDIRKSIEDEKNDSVKKDEDDDY